ncbi:MAG: hypothetical protein RMM06_06325, partial [Armatimonadota bacterium]|nr:hypothetical protein [Armatimonadota bacterium]
WIRRLRCRLGRPRRWLGWRLRLGRRCLRRLGRWWLRSRRLGRWWLRSRRLGRRWSWRLGRRLLVRFPRDGS